jgi:hypothetical protein
MRFQNGFESGELDKWCLGKIDDPAYQQGLAWLENFGLIRAGGINRRKGYKLADKILDIRPPERRKLDREFGPEEYRVADTETAGDEPVSRRADTVFGTSDSTVKLIPLSYNGNKNYLVYVTAQKYGFIEFGKDGGTVRKEEHPWPVSAFIPSSNIFRFNRADPEAYWRIKNIAGMSSRADIGVGTVLDIGGSAVVEAGKFEIAGTKTDGKGKLTDAAPFRITPEAVWNGAVSLTQSRADSKGMAVSFFDEKGAGTGLRVSCTASVKDDTASLSFQVLEGGNGFMPDEGKDTTVLELVVENVGTVVVGATVSSAGSIMGIQDYRIRNYPTAGTGNAVMRWNAPPVTPGLYSEIYDWKGAAPLEPATLEITVEVSSEDAEKELGTLYGITFAVKNKGKGFAVIKASGQDEPDRYVSFLKVAYISDVGEHLCKRELRVVAELDRDGSIKSVHPIPYWIDDDLAAYSAADGVPGEEGDCFSKIMSAAWFEKPDGSAENGLVDEEDGTVPVPESGYLPFKYIVDKNGAGICRWKGYGNAVYTDAERRLVGDGPVLVLQEFAGIWYEKALGCYKASSNGHRSVVSGATYGYASPVLDYWQWWEYWRYYTSKNWYRWEYHVSPSKHLSYPLAYRAEKLEDDKTRVSWYEFDPLMASGCPKPVADPGFSLRPSLQWFDGAQKYAAPYADSLQLFRKDGLEMWFLPPVPEKRANSAPNYTMFSGFQETATGTYAVTNSTAYGGNGAVLAVSGTYVKPTAEHPYGLLSLSVSVKEPGKGYLSRSIDGIVLRLIPDGSGYVYEVPVYAARGSDGMLVLRNQDGTPLSGTNAVYLAEAKTKIVPPATGSTVNLSNGTAEAAAKCVTAPAMNTDGIHTDYWNVSLSVPVMPNGEPSSPVGFALNDALDASWNADNAVYTVKKASKVTSVAATKSYLAHLTEGGKFKTDPAGTSYYGSYGGASYDLVITESELVSQSVLNDHVKDAKPGMYKVQTDEELGDGPSYWVWNGTEKRFDPAVMQTYPETDAVVTGLQYAYTGEYLILCGAGITPFTLNITGGDIALGGVGVKTSADVETVAPKEFGLMVKNSVADAALPPLFMATATVSPSVVAYINGRLWVAGLPDDPSRVYVSKPNRDRKSVNFDFTTYKLVETVTPEYTPFQGTNALGETAVTGVSDGALGLASAYAGNPVTGKKINFGYDRAFVLATPYFNKGAYVESAAGRLELSARSVAVSGEYTARAAANLRNRAALYIGLCRLRVTLPGGFCSISADCDGFEVRVATGTQIIGLTNSLGPMAGYAMAVPYTGWGNGAGRGGVIASAAGAAAAMCGGSIISMVSVAGSCAAVLAVAGGIVDGIIRGMIGSLSLELTDGSSDSPGLGEFGAEYPTTAAIQAKCDYLLAKHRLHEPKQPFVMRRWKADESEYSTPECGFTFKASSDEAEDISLITDMRSIFFATGSSERTMPETVNGAQQSLQTNSYNGAERIQAAKAADALYFVRKGGQGVMRAAYAPNVPVPQIEDLQEYNREILRGRKILGLRGARTSPSGVWCVMDDGKAAVFTDNGGKAAWARVSCGGGDIVDTGAVPSGGTGFLRFMGIRTEDGIYIGSATEEPGEKGDVFLDLWRDYNDARLVLDYGEKAVIYDAGTGTATPVKAAVLPEPGEGKYIGYPYTSRMRTLPGISARTLKPSRVATARFRLLESHLPFIKGYPDGAVNRLVHPLWGNDLNNVKDGVVGVPVPGNIGQDAAFEVFTDVPAPLSVICMIDEEDI